MTALLELRDVSVGYGTIEALHGVDLSVDAGDLLVVVGPNGAGKSTMLAVAAGILAPWCGQLLVGGTDVTGVDPGALARIGVCTVPEGRAVFPNLTVGEHLRMMTHRGLDDAVVEDRAFERFPRLRTLRGQFAGNLSGGEQQMLALARAVATDPAVVLVDELSMGLAPLVVAELFEVVAGLAATGTAVVMVEQFADAALDLATDAAVMANGRVVHRGGPEEIRGLVHDAYLGASR